MCFRGRWDPINITFNRNQLSRKRLSDGTGPSSIQGKEELKPQGPWAPIPDIRENNSYAVSEFLDEEQKILRANQGDLGPFNQSKEMEEHEGEEAGVDSTQSQ